MNFKLHKFAFIAACIWQLSACRTFDPTAERVKHLGESEALCNVAADKKSHVGEELTLSGTLVTDFRHYSMLEAKCSYGEGGLSLGIVSKSEKNEKIESDWWKNYCGSQVPSCITYIPITIRGKLVRREGGIDFDVIEYVEVGAATR